MIKASSKKIKAIIRINSFRFCLIVMLTLSLVLGNSLLTGTKSSAATVDASVSVDATQYVRDGSYRKPNLDDHFGGFGSMQNLNKMHDWGVQSVRHFIGRFFNSDGSLVDWNTYFANSELTNLWDESGFTKWTFVASKVYDTAKYGNGASFDYATYESDLKVILTQLKTHSSGLEYVDFVNEPDLATTGAYSGSTTALQKQAVMLQLYDVAERAVKYVNSTVSNGASLKIGAPSTSVYIYSYIASLIDYAKANNKQLDYLSWHVYSNNARANAMITQYNQAKSYAQSKGFTNIEYQIGEYGMHVGIGDNYTYTDVARIASHVQDLSYGFAYAGIDHAYPWQTQTTYQWSFNQIAFNYVESNQSVGWQNYDLTGVNARYLNLSPRYNSTGQTDIQEIQFLDANNNVIPISYTDFANDATRHGNYTYLFDGDLNTHYTFKFHDYAPYESAIIDLGQLTTVSKMNVYWGSTAKQKLSLTSSTDNVHWNDAISDVRLMPSGMLFDMWNKLDDKLLDSTYTNTLVRAMPTISADGSSLKIMVWNRNDTDPANTNLAITNMPASFQGRNINVKRYLVDSTHSNIAYDPQQNSLAVVDQESLPIQDSSLNLNFSLDHNAVSLIELTPGNIIDHTAPETAATLTPAVPDGMNGWYVHPVSLNLNATDDQSGVAKTEYSLDDGVTWQSYTSPITLSQDGKYTMSYRSTDNAGNVETPKTVSFNLDVIAPTITVTGFVNDTFNDSEDIAPFIALSDDLSGVDNSKTTVTLDTYAVQQGTTIPLYTLPLGSHTFTVISSDLAGNVGSKLVVFQTTASIQSIQELITFFTKKQWIDSAGIANSLQRKLAANDLADFISEVQAQTGKHISSEASTYLLRDAIYVMSKQ